jgi:tRNA(fMet)-specific endonuclease VapC
VAVYLLDTTTFSYLMRDDPNVRARIGALSATDRLAISATVRGEILYGIERLPAGRRRQALEAKAQQLFGALPCEAVEAAVADGYARLKRTAEQAGTSLDENDLWIAATAHALGAVLVTADSDFSRLPVLTMEDWTAAPAP